MSEASTSVVRLDAVEVDDVARRVTAFLLGEQIMVPSPEDGLPTCEWSPGPAAEAVLEDVERVSFWRDLADVGVDVRRGRELHYAMENYGAPHCPRCAAGMEDATYFALLEQWSAGPEPSVSCAACGKVAPLGDWPSAWPSAVGSPAIVFANWPPLSAGFLARLRAVLGGRTLVVRAHF